MAKIKVSRESPGGASRRLPIGAESQPDGRGVHFRVWAPQSESVEVLLGGAPDWERKPVPYVMQREEGGYFSALIREAREGTVYKFRLDSGDFPDPASRFQPRGPHGPSQIVDASTFRWKDAGWKGVSRQGQVIYELHIGTFTKEGTFAAAARELPELASVGITVIELMPVAEFPGRFGWGYDGVDLFAPSQLYGAPDDLRAFVDRAHEVGLGVILDVVYNHFGPDGCYLAKFSTDYTTDRYANEWGQAVNFDGPGSEPVREFFITNAVYWIEEFHFDGFRFDATHQIFDSTSDHILAAITRSAREAAEGRSLFIVAENECQHSYLARHSTARGCGLDALWNDDFHHASMVALTGRAEAYYSDYKGSPQEFISAAKWGYLYQGQWYKHQKKMRGTPTFGLEPNQFINFLQNHDQVANSLRGGRVHQLASPGAYRALTALLLLGPSTPLLFQGQEFAASSRFLYFADHHPELAYLVRKGRQEFLAQFSSIAESLSQFEVNVPESEATFLACKLDFAERTEHAAEYKLHRDLLKLRKVDPVFSAPRKGGIDGAVLGQSAFLLRYFGGEPGDRLLVVNLGMDLMLSPAPEPLLAPAKEHGWQIQWSSEDPSYGGNGTPHLETDDHWCIPGLSAIVLEPNASPPQSETYVEPPSQN